MIRPRRLFLPQKEFHILTMMGANWWLTRKGVLTL